MTEEKLLPLHQAIDEGDINKVKALLKDGIDINVVDKKGRNAAYYAIFSRSIKMLKFVIEHGVSPNYKEKTHGDTLLHMAAGEGNLGMVKYLIKEHHLDINALSKNNYTPLGTCMIWTQMEVACCLIENGALNIGRISHIEALLKYIFAKIQKLKSEIEPYNKEVYAKRIERLENFIKNSSDKIKKPKNHLKTNSEIERVLLEIGFPKGKELAFYKKNLDWNKKEEIIRLFNTDAKDPQIRTYIWECYLRNHVTKLYTSVGFYPAYMLPFTKKEMERDWNKPDCEGVDIADFIKDIGTVFPKFGRDYYFPHQITGLCFSLPGKIKNYKYKESDLCVEENKFNGKMSLSKKYTVLSNIWIYIERETLWLLEQEIDYFYIES